MNVAPWLDELPDELLRLGLSRRTLNCLRYHGPRTIADINGTSDSELLQNPDFGRKSLRELRAALGKNNENSAFRQPGLGPVFRS